MTTLNNAQQTHDVGAEAYNQKTLIIGALTTIAIVAVMYLASTS